MRVLVALLLAECLSLCVASEASAQPRTRRSRGSAPATAVEIDESPTTDHEEARLRPGVSYLGRVDAPLGAEGARDAERVHLVGVRFWFRRIVGLDVGLGGTIHAGSDSETRNGSAPSTFAFALNTSLPIALLIQKHFTLFVAPSLTYAQGGETISSSTLAAPITGADQTAPSVRHTGFSIAVGPRFGAELHLGFIGAARISFTGVVGADVAYTHGSTTTGGSKRTTSAIGLRVVYPWAPVLANVAVTAYF